MQIKKTKASIKQVVLFPGKSPRCAGVSPKYALKRWQETMNLKEFLP